MQVSDEHVDSWTNRTQPCWLDVCRARLWLAVVFLHFSDQLYLPLTAVFLSQYIYVMTFDAYRRCSREANII